MLEILPEFSEVAGLLSVDCGNDTDCDSGAGESLVIEEDVEADETIFISFFNLWMEQEFSDAEHVLASTTLLISKWKEITGSEMGVVSELDSPLCIGQESVKANIDGDISSIQGLVKIKEVESIQGFVKSKEISSIQGLVKPKEVSSIQGLVKPKEVPSTQRLAKPKEVPSIQGLLKRKAETSGSVDNEVNRNK